MDASELLERQDRLHAEARAFLGSHQIESTLAQVGRVLLVGSYVTGLMVWRDLDVLQLLLVDADRVRYEHWDEPGDRRHYFVLEIEGWKLDLSLFTAGIPAEVERFQDELRRGLDDETRLAILRLKELWRLRPEYPEIVGGYEISRAVLGGARSPEELELSLRACGLLEE